MEQLNMNMSFKLDLKIAFKATILNQIWHSVNRGLNKNTFQVPSNSLMFLYFLVLLCRDIFH